MKILLVHNNYGKRSGEEAVVDKMDAIFKSIGHAVAQLRMTTGGKGTRLSLRNVFARWSEGYARRVAARKARCGQCPQPLPFHFPCGIVRMQEGRRAGNNDHPQFQADMPNRTLHAQRPPMRRVPRPARRMGMLRAQLRTLTTEIHRICPTQLRGTQNRRVQRMRVGFLMHHRLPASQTH